MEVNLYVLGVLAALESKDLFLGGGSNPKGGQSLNASGDVDQVEVDPTGTGGPRGGGGLVV